MKCKKCKVKYPALTGGMGCSSTPKEYFIVGMICFFTSILFYILNMYCSLWFGIVAIVMLIYVPIATKDANELINYYNYKCPSCQTKNKVRFWES